MDTDYGICLGCHTQLIPAYDADPNGDMSATCAKCRAEEAHDFDRWPKAVFDRSGNQRVWPSNHS
jgi:hypothetical protein